jgi:multidrug efflux pump subunit AcrA (membrane-fusion protein)
MRATAILLLCLALAGCTRKHQPDTRVAVAQARQVVIPINISLPATIYAKRQASIIPQLTAPVRQILAGEGDDVEEGDVLAVLDNRGVLAQQESALAALEDAKTSLRRALSASPEGDRTRMRYPEVPGARELLRGQPAPQISMQDVAAAEDRVRQAQARLDAINDQLANAELKTPISGTVIDQEADVGDTASPSAPAFVVADLSSVTARAQVPPGQQESIKAGMACSFALNNSSRVLAGGRTLNTGNLGTAACELPNRAGLRPRQQGIVTFETGSTRHVVVIPASAVHAGGYVLVVDGNHVAHRRDIAIGATSGETVTIEKGVAPGETVVTQGLPADGARVQY